MILDFSKLEIGTTRVVHDFAAAEVPFDYRGYSLEGDLRLEADVTKNSKAEVAIKGELVGTVKVYCDRCLDAFDLRIRHPFDIYLIPAHPSEIDRERELDPEELSDSYYTDPAYSLADLANEQLILSLPYKILCADDCKGLCPKCGANLNHVTCQCDLSSEDPRWMLLREMQKKLKNQ